MKELFEQPKKNGASIQQPKLVSSVTRRSAKKKGQDKQARRLDHLLPPDEHFSAKSLVNLFLKPQFAVRSLAFLASGFYSDSLGSFKCAASAHLRTAMARLTSNSGRKLRKSNSVREQKRLKEVRGS